MLEGDDNTTSVLCTDQSVTVIGITRILLDTRFISWNLEIFVRFSLKVHPEMFFKHLSQLKVVVHALIIL